MVCSEAVVVVFDVRVVWVAAGWLGRSFVSSASWWSGVLGLSWVVVVLSLGWYVVGCWLQILHVALRLWGCSLCGGVSMSRLVYLTCCRSGLLLMAAIVRLLAALVGVLVPWL